MEEFDLQPGERVIKVIRMHPFVLALTLVPFVFLAFVPFLLSALMDVAAASGVIPGSPAFPAELAGSGRFLTGLWLLFVWMAAFQAFTRYYLTLWAITTARIVDIEQNGFFNRTVSSFFLMRVQDVTTEVTGILGTLIGFGRLKVQTAGQDEDFIIRDVPHPQEVRDLIMDQVALIHPQRQTPDGL